MIKTKHPTETAHIWLDDDGRAWIDDTNVKVIEVVLDHLDWSLDPRMIDEGYQELSLAQIHAALAYYYDHQEVFDEQIRRDAEEIETMRLMSGESPAVKRLRERGLLPRK